jgi:small subunit ribosomal protein S7
MDEETPQSPDPATEEITIFPMSDLFGKWSLQDIEYADVGLQRYIVLHPYSDSRGKHSAKQFQKSEISSLERLVNRIMSPGKNSGKKQKASQILKESFDLIHKKTEENPVQIFVRAIENSAPREETVRLKYGGVSVPKAVDVSPQRRVDLAIKFLAEGTKTASFKKKTSAHQALATQLIGAAEYDASTYAIRHKEEKERVAAAAR